MNNDWEKRATDPKNWTRETPKEPGLYLFRRDQTIYKATLKIMSASSYRPMWATFDEWGKRPRHHKGTEASKLKGQWMLVEPA